MLLESVRRGCLSEKGADDVCCLAIVLRKGMAVDIHRCRDLAMPCAFGCCAEVDAIGNHQADVRMPELVETQALVMPAKSPLAQCW